MSAGPVPTACIDKPCRSYRPGHHLHVIHARHIGETPWGWRDAVVTAVAGQVVGLSYVDEDACPTVWHHRPLDQQLRAGEPVRLHERYYALGCPTGWFNVVVTGGLGPVPEPEDLSAWRAQTTVGVVDLAIGVGLPMDHLR